MATMMEEPTLPTGPGVCGYVKSSLFSLSGGVPIGSAWARSDQGSEPGRRSVCVRARAEGGRRQRAGEGIEI